MRKSDDPIERGDAGATVLRRPTPTPGSAAATRKSGDPFVLGNATIHDFDHVLVTRQASAEQGELCTYRKMFKRGEGALNKPEYWTERENQFLLEFALKRLKHVVQLKGLERFAETSKTPIIQHIATFDAGLTIKDWLGQKPRYADGKTLAHPFQHIGMLLSLLRACLVALKEIHQNGIVHLDIKEDNICLIYAPYPFLPGSGATVSIQFETLKLIDFAFSISVGYPLKHPLPIEPLEAENYQSTLMKEALREDALLGKPEHADRLDWRADLYSLGYLFGRILLLDDPLTFQGRPGVEALRGAYDLVARLKAFDQAPPGLPLPHDGLIADIDALLDGVRNDTEAYRHFAVVRDSLADDAAPVAATSTLKPTGTAPKAASPSRSLGGALVLLVLFAAVGVAFYAPAWRPQAAPQAPPPVPPQAIIPPPQRLDCPTQMDKTSLAGFNEAAQALRRRAQAQENGAVEAWNTARDAQIRVLGQAQPVADSSGKSRALNCLAALAVAGDQPALDGLKKFDTEYFTSLNAFEEWLKKPRKNRGEPSPGAKLWLENLAAWLALDEGLYVQWLGVSHKPDKETARFAALEDQAIVKGEGIAIP